MIIKKSLFPTTTKKYSLRNATWLVVCEYVCACKGVNCVPCFLNTTPLEAPTCANNNLIRHVLNTCAVCFHSVCVTVCYPSLVGINLSCLRKKPGHFVINTRLYKPFPEASVLLFPVAKIPLILE